MYLPPHRNKGLLYDEYRYATVFCLTEGEFKKLFAREMEPGVCRQVVFDMTGPANTKKTYDEKKECNDTKSLEQREDQAMTGNLTISR
jgi:hypothetical protein